ncbi:ATPase inhibitor [Zalaria obscura]|uniref:ATPase inhibitor n=1 Tax=Zalaria obscura TaxID=2024903 RepID=A0ACC3SD41_9PEZI
MSALRIARAIRPAARSVQASRFSTATRCMAAGDTGATRSGGAAQSDSFNKREKAAEDMYVRNQEREKLAALKKKIADQEAQLQKDREHAEELSKKQD